MSVCIHAEGFISLFIGNTEAFCGHLGSYYFAFAVEQREFNISKRLARAYIDLVDNKRGRSILDPDGRRI